MSNLEFVNSVKIVDLDSLRQYLFKRLDVIDGYIDESQSLQNIEVYTAVAEELRVLYRKLL